MGAAVKSHGPKLFGRAFYESLGSPKVVLAPMVDQSEWAWRMLTRSFLPPESSNGILAYTPMLHARMFADTAKYRDNHFQPLRFSLPHPVDSSRHPAYPITEHFLDGNAVHDRPLFVQFCANSPEILLEAARFVQPFCDAVDLNLGCPQGIARKGHYGAFLQEDWDLIYCLINTLHNELSIPVTAKMRILETKEKTLDYARMILSAGASIITVHGRQREQKGHNTGLADWSVVRYLRDNLPPETVIFANGNVLQYDDIERCLEVTGADGVMSAEANLSDPSILTPPPSPDANTREYWRGPDGKGGYRVDAVLRRYLDILHRHVLGQDPPERAPLFVASDITEAKEAQSMELNMPCAELAQPDRKRQKQGKPKEPTSPNLRSMQAHLFHLLRPLVSIHTDVRDALAKCRAGDIAAFENILQMVENVVKQGIIDYQRGQEPALPPVKSKKELSDGPANPASSSEEAVERCRRPWWVCQSHVRPLPHEAIEKGAMTLSKSQKTEKNLTRPQNWQSTASADFHLKLIGASRSMWS